MLQIENAVYPSVSQFSIVVGGMRNPYDSWERSDSTFNFQSERPETCDGCECQGDDSCSCEIMAGPEGACDPSMSLGKNDMNLMRRLCKGGSEHRKFLRQLPVIMDITAPLYWWKQMDQYKVGTVTDSCSTMHTLLKNEFTLGDFSVENALEARGFAYSTDDEPLNLQVQGEFVQSVVDALNRYRAKFLETGNSTYWYAINEMLPQSYNQKRTWSGNYEVLRTICRQRKGHKLPEWGQFRYLVRRGVPFADELIFNDWGD